MGRVPLLVCGYNTGGILITLNFWSVAIRASTTLMKATDVGRFGNNFPTMGNTLPTMGKTFPGDLFKLVD